MKGIRKGSLVVVDWLDTHTPHTGWTPPASEDFKPAPVRSVGFVMNADRHAITLAGDGQPKDPHKAEVNRPITIPVGMVTRVRVVRLSRCEVVG